MFEHKFLLGVCLIKAYNKKINKLISMKFKNFYKISLNWSKLLSLNFYSFNKL